MKLKKQNPHTDNLDAYFEKRLGKERCDEIIKQAHAEVEILLAMHKPTTSSVDKK